ncbi:MAG: NAD(P) transhydrogenase subunit alpha [Acidimicrobiales bacterium]
MRVGVPAEPTEAEKRVALTPDGARTLVGKGHTVVVENGAGHRAGFDDAAYDDAGAAVGSRAESLDVDLVVGVTGDARDLTGGAEGRLHIALFDPLWDPTTTVALAEAGADVMALELVPRTTRAQNMDVLSSMATVAGYEAVLLAARRLPRLFPMLMTAAGTVPPAKVLVLGAGVAGLQAIATARRLGAVVSAYDVRPAAAEQIASLGARVVEISDDTSETEGVGGYAREQTEEDNRRRRELLAPHVAGVDVLITTAAIPGRPSPLLVTTDMVTAMTAGSVVVDLAAARGGNCGPTVADAEIVEGGVSVLGPTRLESGAATTASRMLSTNLVNLLGHLAPDGSLQLDRADPIVEAMLVATGGSVVDERVAAAAAEHPRSR